MADDLENYRKMCLEIYKSDHIKFILVPRLVRQVALKKTEVKLKLSTDIDIILMVEKGIRSGIYHSVNRYVKANDKYMKDYDENKELLCLKSWDVIIHIAGQYRKSSQ